MEGESPVSLPTKGGAKDTFSYKGLLAHCINKLL